MAKTRKDAWGEDLPESTRREIFALTKPPTDEEREAGRAWLRDYDSDVLPWLSLQGYAAPSRAAWYRFLGRMREEDASRTIIGVETAKRIAQGVAKADVDPRLAADMMTALSVDEAAKPPEERNEKAMQMFASAAALFTASAQRAAELELKDRAQKTKDETLRLAREKFEYDAAKKAMELAAEIKTVAADDALDDDEKIRKVREALFG